MTSLSPEARALLEPARRALQPRPADRERVTQALSARLGPQAFAPEVAPGPSGLRAGLRSLPAATTVTCVLGGALLLGLATRALKPAASDLSSAARSESPRVYEREPKQTTSADPPPEAASPRPATAVGPKRATLRRQDALGHEVALLSRATLLLKAGRLHEALRTLDLHAQSYPHGLLSQERRAAKAQALCLLRRIAEGRAEAAHLGVNAPVAQRVREACDQAASPARTLGAVPASLEVPK